MKEMERNLFCCVLIVCAVALLCVLPAIAEADQSYSVPGKNYVLPDSSEYNISDGKLLKDGENFFYGNKSMGSLRVIGTVDNPTTYDGLAAYGTNGSVSIHYQYGGSYQYTNILNKWYVDDDGMGKVNGYNVGGLFKGVGHGCIIIEKSSDGKKWDKIKDPILNYFTKAKDSGKSLIYSVPEYEIKNGCYYRVLVAYRFCKKTKNGVMWIGDKHEYKKCMEVYTFYVSSEKNYVTVHDMADGKVLADKYTVNSGFVIHRNGSQATVSVVNKEENCKDYAYYTDPGDYEIITVTKLGKVYHLNLNVTDGMDFTPVQKKIYESAKNTGFPLNKAVSVPVFGSALTSLSLATPKGTKVKQKDSGYGITGQSASLYLRINNKNNMAGWWLESDSWGGRNKELVCGVMTGEVGKGALIIQTSPNGKNWKNVDKGRYAKGLYTTDFAGNYGKDENVLIYTPRGEDILNGVYIQVLFAFQVKKLTADEYRDYVEAYQFYLCFDDLGAVTFHNLSVEDTLDEIFADTDKNTAEVYKRAESLESGSYTVTGFSIDKTGNPTVNHTVLCDGKSVSNTKNSYKETGKYDIKLTSPVGSTRALTIYVDSRTPEESMNLYFGEGFISGKRIFSEGEYPVYESGDITYHIAALEDNVLPLYGQIKNLSTGSEITVRQDRDEKTGVISEPGEYQAVFATSEKYFTDELAGDARVFTFRFNVIDQGTAPGPVVNQRFLNEYSHSTVADSNPVYYGLTYSSAGKGKITLAFASREEAARYAYEYEKGMVEKQENGGHRYSGSFVVDQSIRYDSTWELTDAVNYYAEAAVHRHYFDMSDEFTYLTLRQEELDKSLNLRQLELSRSVTIFADGQKEKLTDIDALPLLNDKLYAYLDPASGEVDRGSSSFEFITDQYGGIDSKTVTITDSEGGKHSIRYSESVGKQLSEDNCPSGIVTIREETMYGDFSEYQAVYIAPEDNRTELTLAYTQGDDTDTAVYKGSGNGPDIVADSFMITGLGDPLDPYAFVVVSHNQKEDIFSAKEESDTVWSDPGEYRITCLNRMGYGYVVPVTVTAPDGVPAVATSTEITAEPASTPEPVDSNAQTMNEINTADTVTALPLKTDENAGTTASQAGQRTMPEEQKSGESTLVILGILAGLVLIAALIVSVYRKGKMYSRMTDAMKSGEDNKHE